MQNLIVNTYRYKDLPRNARRNAIQEYKEKLHKNGIVDGIILNRLKQSLKRKGLPTKDIDFSIGTRKEDFVHFYGPVTIKQFIDTFNQSLDDYPELGKLDDMEQNAIFQIEPVSCVFCENQNNMLVSYYLLNSEIDGNKYHSELASLSRFIHQKSLETAISLIDEAYRVASDQYNENVIENELIKRDYEFLENGAFINPALFDRISYMG
ncbi:hypothetical protein [Methanohalobium sp.]|uniref:hypothetical protein n=1 Tax=Methanohalobium sp. TaxID=2837493 RepID=UPI0025CFA4CC|nr:hypothetical protein [Methanohalobium sp.]